MIYTSYWSNLKNLDKNLVVNISRWNKFWTGKNCDELKPSVKMLIDFKEGKIGVKEYTYFFKWYLTELDVKELAARLDGKILCCYEKSGFCHRHIVSEWFNHFGFQCMELSSTRQGVLF